MYNYKLIIQYDGSRYDGWQKQGNTANTIQGKLEGVLSAMFKEPIEINGAGRTDAGVHAKGQVANFKSSRLADDKEIKDYVNQYLPNDIAVIKVEKVQERFHARLNAKAKKYRYMINNSIVPDVFERKYYYQYTDTLDVNKMEEACEYLIGTHDFKSFCTNKRMKKSTVREIYDIEITKNDSMIIIDYYGEGFLYNMIRIITGTLIEVGNNTRSPEEIIEIIEACDRSCAGFTAPACGLMLMEVEY